MPFSCAARARTTSRTSTSTFRSNELVVVTGRVGSGKSSLVFDTLYAEGQRRYVETFSPYARQFLDRMDKPQVDRIEGIPPAIAIDQTNPVRTSRSTVGTMTELNDHLKLLFARAATLYCRVLRPARCGATRRRPSTPICGARARSASRRSAPAAHVSRCRCRRTSRKPKSASCSRSRATRGSSSHRRRLGRRRQPQRRPTPSAGAARAQARRASAPAARRARRRSCSRWCRTASAPAARSAAACSRRSRPRCASAAAASTCRSSTTAIRRSSLDTLALFQRAALRRLRPALREPTPSLFSFNSPVGACETCRGFGRTIGVDYGLVIPGREQVAARRRRSSPGRRKSYAECQDDLDEVREEARHPARHAVARARRRAAQVGDRGRRRLDARNVWYGVKRFFDWLETKAYKMHVRVLLSRYRAYTPCSLRRRAAEDRGAAVARRHRDARRAALAPAQRFLPRGRAVERRDAARRCPASPSTT